MVKYRLATEKDYQNINDFHNRIYKSNRTIEEFYWEFHNCPFGNSIYVVAEDSDKIIGTNCVIPIDLISSENKIIRSGKSEDTLVDPLYRGKKIFYHIYQFLFKECEKRGIKVIWGFTSAKKPFKNLGFSIPFDHQQSLAVNDIWNSYKYLSGLNKNNKVKDKIKILGLSFFSKIKLIWNSPSKVLDQYHIRENQKIIEEVDKLIYSNLNVLNSSFAIHQNSAFQTWRIYQNPNYYKTHTFGFYDANDNLKSLIVLNSHQNKVAYVCQSSFHPELNDTATEAMIRYITRKMFDQGIYLIRNWQFDNNILNSQEIKRYVNANHTHLKRGISFVWKELDNIDITPSMFFLSRISTQGVI